MRIFLIILGFICIVKAGSSQKAFDYIDYIGYRYDTLIRFRFANGYEYGSIVQMIVNHKEVIFYPKEIDKFIFTLNNKTKNNNLIQIRGGNSIDGVTSFPNEIMAVHTSGKQSEHRCNILLKLKNK